MAAMKINGYGDALRIWIMENETLIIRTLGLLVVLYAASSALSYLLNQRLMRAIERKDYKSYHMWLRLGGSLTAEHGKDGVKPLMAACKLRATDIVLHILQTNNRRARDYDTIGRSPIHYAVEGGSTEIVGFLLDYKARVDASTDEGESALLTAARIGNVEMVEYLISKKALVKWKTHEGCTALMTCVRNLSKKPECLPVLRALIKNKADINATLKNGRTVLHEACMFGDVDVVDYLIAQGANVKARDNDDVSCFYVALEFGMTDVVRLLLTKYATDIDKKDNQKSLLYACYSSSLEIVKILIEKKRYDLEYRTKDNNLTILMVALNQETDDIARQLLGLWGVTNSINDVTKDGWNALFWCLECGHIEVAIELIEKWHINLDQADLDGWTALMIAVRNGEAKVVESILKVCSKELIDKSQNDGWSALAIAIATGDASMVQLLIDHHANVNAQQDPIAIFSQMKNSLHKRLKRFGCIGDKTCSVLLLAVLCEHEDCVEALCKAGADVYSKSASGYDAYTIAKASKTKSKEMLAVLTQFDEKKIFGSRTKFLGLF